MQSCKVPINIFFAELMLLSFLIPNRGIFVGTQYLVQFAIFIIWVFLNINKFNKNFKLIPKWVTIYFSIIIICVIKHFATRSLLWNLYEIVPPISALLLTLNCAIRSDDNFNKLTDFILKIVTIYSVLCIIESLTKINLYDFICNDKVTYAFANEIRFGIVRNRGLFSVSINNGAFLTMNLCLCCYRMITERLKKYKIMYLLILIAAFLGISRVIWIYISISQIVIFLGLKSSKKVKLLLFLGLLICAFWIIGLTFPSSFFGSFCRMIDEMIDTTLSGIFINSNSQVKSESGLYGIGARFELWEWIFDATKDSLFWGNGFYETFRHVYTVDTVKTSIEVTYLFRLFKTGIIGMSGLIMLQISSLISSIKNLKRCEKFGVNYFFIISFLGMCVGLYIAQLGYASLEDFNFYFVYLGMYISCVLNIQLNIKKIHILEHNNSTKKSFL